MSLTILSRSEPSAISDKVIAEIEVLSRIAQANGSLVSIHDIVALTSIKLPEEQIEKHWQTVPNLAGRFEFKAGFLCERVATGGNNSPARLKSEMENRTRAKNYNIFAQAFAPFLKEKEATLVAVSGSTSYQSASVADDLDFFQVTRPGFLWTYIVKSMFLARAFRLFNRNSPRICFSYAVDEEYANKEFSSSKDPLFARDALTLMVIHGTETYRRLLTKSSWMSKFYPKLFDQRSRDTKAGERLEEHFTPSTFRKFSNQLVYLIISKYLATKSAMLNRRLGKSGKSNSLFSLRIGPDHFVIESVRYSHLRQMYGTLKDIVSRDDPPNLT